MDKPDKIWAGPGAYPTFSEDDWTNASASADVEFGSVYLLSTPERELASELVEATKELRRAQKAYMMNRGVERLGQIVGEAAKAVDAVLAKLEGKG